MCLVVENKDRFRSSKNWIHDLKEITDTLVKLSVASTGHGWVVPTVDFGNVISLDVGYFVHCQVASKGHL